MTEKEMASDGVLMKLQATRRAFKGHFTRNRKKGEDMMSSNDRPVDQLETLMATMIERLKKISLLDGEIQTLVDADKIEEEIKASLTFDDEMTSFFTEVNLFLKSKEDNSVKDERPSEPVFISDEMDPVRSFSNIKLPKITIKEFSGDPLDWLAFWDSFESAVHVNPNLSNVEKMNYLKGLLKGDAAKAIGGFMLSNTNYITIINILNERFGRRQEIINAYMEKFLNVPGASNDVKSLRKLCDTIENCIRGLESLDHTSDTYGSLLIPILLKKLPEDITSVLIRDGGDVNIILFREILKKEVMIRERISELSKPNKKSVEIPNNNPFSSAMFVGNEEKKQYQQQQQHCVYCGKEHSCENCVLVKDIERRANILKKHGRCFRCLGKNHVMRRCPSQIVCKICSKNHHVSICRGIKNEEKHNVIHKNEEKHNVSDHTTSDKVSAQFFSGSCTEKGSILLQSACVTVSSEKVSCRARVLFDSGSQRTFVTKKLAKILNCSITCQEMLNISSFGVDKYNLTKFDLVPIGLETGKETLFVDALVADKISVPIPMKIDRGWLEHPKLRDLTLADRFDEDSLNVDIIIGNDFYGSLITGRMIKEDNLIAMESKFGWLLSGHCEKNRVCSDKVSCFKISAQPMNDIFLDEAVRKFWERNSVDSGESDEQYETRNVVKQFNETIRYDEDEKRYAVQLPWKMRKIDLPTNINMCKRRLKSVIQKLKRIKRIKDYDHLLKDQIERGFIERIEDPGDPFCRCEGGK